MVACVILYLSFGGYSVEVHKATPGRWPRDSSRMVLITGPGNRVSGQMTSLMTSATLVGTIVNHETLNTCGWGQCVQGPTRRKSDQQSTFSKSLPSGSGIAVPFSADLISIPLPKTAAASVLSFSIPSPTRTGYQAAAYGSIPKTCTDLVWLPRLSPLNSQPGMLPSKSDSHIVGKEKRITALRPCRHRTREERNL